VRTLVIGQIFFPDNGVCHDIAVQKILFMLLDESKNTGWDKRRAGQELIAEIHMGQGTPGKDVGRDKNKSRSLMANAYRGKR